MNLFASELELLFFAFGYFIFSIRFPLNTLSALLFATSSCVMALTSKNSNHDKYNSKLHEGVFRIAP